MTAFLFSVPKCPELAIRAKFIPKYGKCYSIELTRRKYIDAQASCHEMGGILGEPPVNTRAQFFADLKEDRDLRTAIGNIISVVHCYFNMKLNENNLNTLFIL